MPTPPDRAERLTAMFDSYCKTVLRNTSRNEKRALTNRNKHETIADERTQYLFDTESYVDTYSSERFVLWADKFSCVVFNDTLYYALLLLPENQRTVLMLDFWYHWTDEQIAIHLGVTSRTVYNLWQRAFKVIRKFFEKRMQ